VQESRHFYRLALATKTGIALARFERLLDEGAALHSVLADTGCGIDHEFRQRLSDRRLP
jgi:SRSO17 transposase